MNVLPISDGAGSLAPWAGLRVLSTMYFPHDKSKQDAFLGAIVGDALFDVLRGNDPDARAEILAALVKPGLLDILRTAGAAPVLIDEARAAVARGNTAASVLATIIRSEPFGTLSSVTRAERLVMLVQDRGSTPVDDDWRDFKSVAHLYLAMTLFNREARTARVDIIDGAVAVVGPLPPEISESEAREIAEGELDRLEPDIFEVFHDANFEYFLALGEKIRRTAEAQSAARNTKAWMPAGYAFAVPDDITLGDVRLLMPALTAEEMKVLGGRGDPPGKRREDQSA